MPGRLGMRSKGYCSRQQFTTFVKLLCEIERLNIEVYVFALGLSGLTAYVLYDQEGPDRTGSNPIIQR